MKEEQNEQVIAEPGDSNCNEYSDDGLTSLSQLSDEEDSEDEELGDGDDSEDEDYQQSQVDAGNAGNHASVLQFRCEGWIRCRCITNNPVRLAKNIKSTLGTKLVC